MKNYKHLLLLAFVLPLLAHPVTATLDFNQSYFFSGTNEFTESTAGPGGWIFSDVSHVGAISKFLVNFDNIEVISTFKAEGGATLETGALSATPVLNSNANGINAKYTTFTSTVAGQFYGSGEIGWERTTGNNFRYIIIYDTVDANYAKTLSGSTTVVLSYDLTVYTTYVTQPNAGSAERFTQPGPPGYTYAEIGITGFNPTFADYTIGAYSQADTIASFTDTATVTANSTDGFSYINLTKNSVNYRFNITNSTGSSFYDVTSITDVSQLLNRNNGISFQLEHVGLASWVNRTIYVSGGATPTPTITPTPTPTAQPPFSNSNFINTTKGIYNNTESEDIYGSFYPATTTQEDCLFFGFFCTETTINTESTTGYVFIRTQGSTSPIQFLPFTVDQSNNFNVFTTLDIGTYQAQLYGFASPGSTCPSGVVYDFPQIPLGCYYPHNITTFQVVNNTPGLFIHWQTKLANSTAVYGDTVTVAWNNVTANDIVKIYDNTGTAVQTYWINISNVNQIPVFIPLYSVGVWNATIYNGSNLANNASAFLNVVPPGAIAVNNSFGITMFWAKATDIIDTPTLLNWNTGSYSGLYHISVLLNGVEVRNNSYAAVPGQAQQAVYTFDTTGTYVAEFLDVNGTIQQQSDIQITQPVISATSTPPIPSGNEASQSLGNNLLLFMAMPAFWGLILWILIVYGVASSPAHQSTGLIAFIAANILAVIGLWSPFTWYILAVTWIFAGVYFYFGRDVTR